MEWNTIINFLLIAGVVQGFVFNLVTLFFRKKFSIVILYLNLTVLFISLNNLQAWLRDNGYSSDFFFMKNLLVPWYLFIFPMFYAFLIHYLRVQDKIVGFVRFSIGLFLVEFILRLGVISYVYYNVEGRDLSLIKQYTYVEDIFNLMVFLFIFYKAWMLVFRRQKTYETMLRYDELSWIKLFLYLASLILLLWASSILVEMLTGANWLYGILRVATSLIIYWIGYQGLYRYNVVQDRIMLRKDLVKSQKFISLTPNRETPANEKHQLELDRIREYVIENKKYLNPNLTMNSLADELNMSTSHLSKIINVYGNFTFPDFINGLRVEQAKKLLADPNFNKYTVTSIGLECGFNSRSTFYKAFKKFTSKTPTDYQEGLPIV